VLWDGRTQRESFRLPDGLHTGVDTTRQRRRIFIFIDLNSVSFRSFAEQVAGSGLRLHRRRGHLWVTCRVANAPPSHGPRCMGVSSLCRVWIAPATSHDEPSKGVRDPSSVWGVKRGTPRMTRRNELVFGSGSFRGRRQSARYTPSVRSIDTRRDGATVRWQQQTVLRQRGIAPCSTRSVLRSLRQRSIMEWYRPR
jgi:hypothetical protein